MIEELKMKKLNEKSKIEQLFIITLMFVTLMAMFCLTGCGGCFGCGGNSCEKIKCSNEEKISGISIPGCGGILTSGRGCNFPLWAQSIKCISSKDDKKADNYMSMKACDVRYYGGGCFGCIGCSQTKKSFYSACVKSKNNNEKHTVMVFGHTKDESNIKEISIGCSNGCVGIGCSGDNRTNIDTIYELEYLMGVD